MRCRCGKFAHDPNCDRPEHSAPQSLDTKTPAFYEERIRLLLEENHRLRRKVTELRRELEGVL